MASTNASPTSADVFDDDRDSAGRIRARRLPFTHWLMLRHREGDEFYPLAHLVLSGGPDDVWARRHDLLPTAVHEDVRLFYAAGRHGVSAEHVDLAARAERAWVDDAPTVAEAEDARRDVARDGDERLAAAAVSRAVARPYLDRGVPVRDDDALVGRVTDADGDDVAYDMVPVRPATCRFVYDNGTPCNSSTVPGGEMCTRHGGRVYTDLELRSIHRVAKEKLIGAAEKAVDNLVELFDSPNDMVRLKASEMVLDRVGFVPGVEVTVTNSPAGDRTAADVIAERIARLAAEPPTVDRPEPDAGDAPGPAGDDDDDVVDADVVEDGEGQEPGS